MAKGLGYIQDQGIYSTKFLLFTVSELQTILSQQPALMIVEHYAALWNLKGMKFMSVVSCNKH